VLSFRLRLEFEPNELNEATQTFRSLLGPVRAEPGCSATRLLRDMDRGSAVTWVEEWREWEDFERHLSAASFRKIVATMELAVRVPKVEIDDVAQRRGFDFVEELYARRLPEDGDVPAREVLS